MKFSIKDFFSKCDQIRRKLRNWSHLLKKSLIENFIFCAVTQGFFVELNLRKRKWLLCCLYKPHKNQLSKHLKETRRNVHAFSPNYDNLILLDDFNLKPTEKHTKDFSLIYNYKISLEIKPVIGPQKTHSALA